MPLTNAAVQELNATSTAKFVSQLEARVDKAYEAFIQRDTFGAEGYVPLLIGGVGSGQEWIDQRLNRSINEYGVRFHGKVYENSVKLPNTTLADSPVIKGAAVGSKMATSAELHEEKTVYAVLKANANGFDGDPIFGDHTYSDAVDAPVFTNDIAGSGAAWYLVNGYSLVVADREGENYTPQFHGGPGTEIYFNEDKTQFGWRARKLFVPGFWANVIRSKTALTADNLQAALTLAASFKDDAGDLLGTTFTTIVVPRSLEAACDKLLKAALINGGDTNTNMNKLKVIVSDLL